MRNGARECEAATAQRRAQAQLRPAHIVRELHVVDGIGGREVLARLDSARREEWDG